MVTPRPEYKSLRCSLSGESGWKRGNWFAVAIFRRGFVISAREAALRPSPRTRASANFDRSEMVVFMEPATRTLLRLSCGCGWPSSFQPSATLGSGLDRKSVVEGKSVAIADHPV